MWSCDSEKMFLKWAVDIFPSCLILDGQSKNFHELLSAKEISNSEPVRWPKSMSTSQKCKERNLAEVATGAPWRKPPCIPEWQFHAPTSAGQESRRHQMLSRSHCPAVETTQNTKGVFKVSVRPLLPPKKKGSKTKQLLDPQGAISSPFSPLLPIMTPNWPDKVILQCSACHNNTSKWYFYLYWGGKAFQ